MTKNESGQPPVEVARVICASVSLVQGSVMDELFRLRNQLCASGHDPRVSSALLHASGCFVFWIEGYGPVVQQVLARLAVDDRHESVETIHRSHGAATLTEPLNVVCTQGSDHHTVFQRRIRHFREEMEAAAAIEPGDIWRCLVAPCSPAPGSGAARLPDRHVALVSAEDNGPIDLLRRLGERFGNRVVYQRFAGAKSYTSDVGLAYVDLRGGQHVTRVHLLSRRALGHSIVRQSLGGLDELVMLMGSRPAAAIDLATGVADCVNGMPKAPVIYQVAERPEVAATIARLMQRSAQDGIGLRIKQVQEEHLENFLLAAVPRAVRGSQLAYG